MGFPFVVEGGVGFEEGGGKFGEEFRRISTRVVGIVKKVRFDPDPRIEGRGEMESLFNVRIPVAVVDAFVMEGVGKFMDEAAPGAPAVGVFTIRR